MRKLIVISVLGTVLGYAAVHFAFFAKPKPVAQEPVAVAPAEPVVLAQVIEVTDTDALLDPRPTPQSQPSDATGPDEFTAPGRD